jgi:LuxR family maltose regulon positive regulatory protein
LIRTKLQRPQLGQDLILRPHLVERLNRGTERRLTLISAQAGAGKTTLLAQWLSGCPLPSAWLSLDAHDNDLMGFVSYLCAALQSAIPAACADALELLYAPNTPPPRVVITAIVNELDALFAQPREAGTPHEAAPGLIVALDDYHVITNPEIHAFVANLLTYMPPHLHLVITSRTDPPLPLAGLRARRQMVELRTTDLRFSRLEAATLLAATVGRDLQAETIDLLGDKTEGWAVGLRLAALSLRNAPDDRAFAQRFEATGSSMVVDYLATEVLAGQSPAHQEFLLRTSILERLEARLCAAVLGGDAGAPAAGASGAILHELLAANLFLLPLDLEGRWFRYHHLFRDLLHHRLHREQSADEIRALHRRASRWFAENGLIDEALTHAFAADDREGAVAIVAGELYALMNQARWQQLDRYLRRFPPEFADRQPELLILKAWLLYHQGHTDKLPAIIRQFEIALDATTLPAPAVRHLQGEASALRSLLAYYQTDIERTIAEAEFFIAHTPPPLWIVRILARLCLAGALQMRGETRHAEDALFRGADAESVDSKPFRATLLLTACSLYWLLGDLERLAQAAGQCLDLCDYPHATEIAGYAHYHLGAVHYQRNELAAAAAHFDQVVRQPYLNYGQPFVDSTFGLALIHHAQGRDDDAYAVAADAIAHMLETGNTTLWVDAQAFQAELALRQGQVATAERWAEQFDSPPPLIPMVRFYRPSLTLAKAWLVQGTAAGYRQAAALLDQLEEYAAFTHNKSVLIEVLALQAVRHAAAGDDIAAVTKLTKAIALAEPGGFIRIFVDLGPELARLLRALDRKRVPGAYIDRILAAFALPSVAAAPGNGAGQGAASLVEPLTPREVEVLALLADRLTNQEIAAQLVIAPGTVKTHTLNLYAKLAVHGRRQAVARARTLGLLPAAPRG